jgi:hypothetical protein
MTGQPGDLQLFLLSLRHDLLIDLPPRVLHQVIYADLYSLTEC